MTLDEIAKLSGVSRTTASYVINGKAKQYRISEKTQARVMEVVNAHNFRPDHAAQSLRAGSNRSIGLIIPDLENSSYATIAKLLEREARKAGYQLIISCSDDDINTEIKVAETLLSRRIDALIVATALPAEHIFYRNVMQSNTPVIAIDRAMDDDVFACVISEDLEGALSLTQTFLQPNIQSIGLIGAVPELCISQERQQGFMAALKDNNNIHTIISHGDHFSQQQGQQQAQTWIDNNEFPDAILATSYTLFEGILDCLLKYPDLMAKTKLATFGDNRLLDFLPSKIQSLPQQFELIATQALTLALKAIKGDYQAGASVVARRLIHR